MKKLSKYKLDKISKNLDYFFDQATNQDVKEGLSWYSDANRICREMAKAYPIDTFTAAQVISALSPRNKWEQNIKDAWKVLDAVFIDDQNPEDIKVCTFHSNKYKAFAIARGEVEIASRSPKTYAFCKNIAFLDNDYVTVDIWHLRACFNKIIKIDSASIGKVAYEQISELTKSKAKALGFKGFEFQAIIWGSIRNS